MKYITIKDIARHLSISVSTVSRALGDDKNIRKETKEKVIEAAKRLGYRPNPVAINLKYGHTNTVGVIVPEMVTPFASRVINGIQEVLHTKNIKVIIAESGGDPEKDLEQKAEEFITAHHSSFVSLYLLDKYFVQKDSPDFNKIKKLIEVMTGILQDKLYIEQLNEAISLSEKTEIGKYAPFFSLPNIKGEKITRSSEDLKKKNLLINFWASWTDSISNHQSNSELKELYQKYKKNKHIAMLGVSFDMDKKEWQDAIKRDTLNWEQVCDFGGLNSEVAKQYAIKEVPSNILLSADGKILAKNLKGEQLKKKIEEVVTAAEEKEKQDNKKKK